jgi:hypothetical protein
MVAGDESKVDYLVIGRLAEALMRKGHTVNRADTAEWRINKSFVGHLAELTKAAMAEAKPRVVVVTGIEESYFMAQFEVGYTLPATKDAAGRHHINGELVVANADTQLRFLQTMEPIWVATGGTTTVVVSPMARYLTKGCCEEPGHITNKGDPNYAKQMKADRLAAKYKMKRYFKDNGHQHCFVMYPAKDLEDEDLSKIWGDDDPTLPLPAVFDKMAAAIRVAEERADLTGAKRAGGGHDGPPPKRARLESGNDGQVTGNPAPDGQKKGAKGKKGRGGKGNCGGGTSSRGGLRGPGGTRGAASINNWHQPDSFAGRGGQRRGGGGGGGQHSSGGQGSSGGYYYGAQDWRYDERSWPQDNSMRERWRRMEGRQRG